MARIGINQTSFEKGQYSAEFAGKYDSEEYRLGCAEIQNAIVTPEGAILRAPGTKQIRTGDDYAAKDVSFEVDANNTAIITFNPSSNNIVIEDPFSGTQTVGSSGVTVSTFDEVQVRDSLIIVDRSFFPKELKRANNGTWSIANFPLKDGPWEDLNLDNKLKIRPRAGFTSGDDGFTGTNTILAVNKQDNSKAWFLDEWVAQGRKIRLRQSSGGEVTEANLTLNSVVTTGSVFNVTVDDDYPLLAEGPGSDSKNWRLSAWYADNYPTHVTVHQDRLWFFRDQWRWSTISGGLTEASPTLPTIDDSDWVLTDDSAISLNGIEATSSEPQWAVSHRVLHLGTDIGTNIFQGGNFFDKITPSNASFLEQNKVPASSISPQVGTFLYYVDSSFNKIYRLEYQWVNQGFVPSYINRNNREIFNSLNKAITDFIIINDPFKMMWISLEDGTLVVGTANENEQEWAWSTIDYGNPYISGITKAKEQTSDGVKTRIYLRVAFNIGSGLANSQLFKVGEIVTAKGSQRSIPNGAGGLLLEDVEEYSLHNVTETSGGTPIDLNTIGSGNVVVDMTNYQVWQYSTVSETVTPANNYQIGTPFYFYLKFNLVDLAQSQQSSLKDNKKILRMYFNVKDTADFQVRDSLADNANYSRVNFRRSSDDPFNPPALFTGVKEFDGMKTDKKQLIQLELTQDTPTPFQINSITYDIDIDENR